MTDKFFEKINRAPDTGWRPFAPHGTGQSRPCDGRRDFCGEYQDRHGRF